MPIEARTERCAVADLRIEHVRPTEGQQLVGPAAALTGGESIAEHGHSATARIAINDHVLVVAGDVTGHLVAHIGIQGTALVGPLLGAIGTGLDFPESPALRSRRSRDRP